MKKYIGTLAIVFVSVFAVVLSSYRAFDDVFAHGSPEGCTGSGLGITLYVSPTDAKEGDVLSYSALIYNGRSGTPSTFCDATGITASITTPDGTSHPLSLSRTSLLALEQDEYTNAVTYTARASDVQGGILRATANVTGTIHQNDTDSTGGGNQGVNADFIEAPTPPSSTPSPSPTETPTPSSTPSPSPSETPVATPSPTPPPSSGGGSSTSSGGGSYVAIVPVVTPIPPVVVPIIPVVQGWPNTGIGPDDGKSYGKDIYISIPAISVNALVEEVGVKGNGELTSPRDPKAVGMYDFNAKLTVIDGHRGWHEKTAVFDDLHTLKVGDKVYSKDSSGKIIKTFVVVKTQVYDKDSSSKEVFKVKNDSVTRLNLITCDGDWIPTEETYAKRLVVFTEEVR